MSKGQRNRDKVKKKKFTQEQIEAMARILKASKLTRLEKLVVWFYSKQKMKIRRICKKVYGFNLRHESKSFRKRLYKSYGEDRLFQNYGNTHLLCITKCGIMDNNWENWLTKYGNKPK